MRRLHPRFDEAGKSRVIRAGGKLKILAKGPKHAITEAAAWDTFYVHMLLAAVGLAGKVLGPVGLFRLIVSGAWPTTIILCLTNDMIWGLPIGHHLYDAWPTFCRDMQSRSNPPGADS